MLFLSLALLRRRREAFTPLMILTPGFWRTDTGSRVTRGPVPVIAVEELTDSRVTATNAALSGSPRTGPRPPFPGDFGPGNPAVFFLRRDVDRGGFSGA